VTADDSSPASDHALLSLATKTRPTDIARSNEAFSEWYDSFRKRNRGWVHKKIGRKQARPRHFRKSAGQPAAPVDSKVQKWLRKLANAIRLRPGISKSRLIAKIGDAVPRKKWQLLFAELLRFDRFVVRKKKNRQGVKEPCYWPASGPKFKGSPVLIVPPDDDAEDAIHEAAVIALEAINNGGRSGYKVEDGIVVDPGKPVANFGSFSKGTLNFLVSEINRNRARICDHLLRHVLPYKKIQEALDRYKSVERTGSHVERRFVRRLLFWTFGIQMPTVPGDVPWWSCNPQWPELLTRLEKIDEPKDGTVRVRPESKINSGHYDAPIVYGRRAQVVRQVPLLEFADAEPPSWLSLIWLESAAMGRERLLTISITKTA
jgi:hypothetical protein